MKDYYKILDIPKTSDQEDVKKAYRKMAAKHHPDRGGDTQKFQEIEEAYRILSDPNTRAEYDNPQPQFRFTASGFDFHGDIFEQMMKNNPFGFSQRVVRKNKDVNIRVQMTLEEILTGKEVVGNIKLPSGKDEYLQIRIPRGVSNGDNIKFRDLGDDSNPNLPKGDLIATVIEIPNNSFQRNGPHLHTSHTVSIIDLILGTKFELKTIDNKVIEIAVPAGFNPGSNLSCNGYGLPTSIDSNLRGNLFVQINTRPIKITDPGDKEILNQIKMKYDR